MNESAPQLLMTACLLLAATCASAQTTERAERLVQQIRLVKSPALDPSKMGDAEYMKQQREGTKQAIRQRGSLIFALFKEDPENHTLIEFLPQRWMDLELLADNEDELAQVLQSGIKETEELLLPPPNLPNATFWPDDLWHQMCRYWRGRMVIRLNRGNWPAQLGVVKDYIQETPSYPTTHSELLLQAAFQAPSAQQAAEAYRMIVEKYPLDHLVPTVKGFLRRIEGVGQPVSFNFVDPKTKKLVKTESLRGKVLLLDFFRHQPERMEARLALLKELHASYGEDLAIISICVTPASGAGAKSLESAVLQWAGKENIQWLVAIVGERAQADFLTGWNMTALPEAFLVNKKGMLAKLGQGLNLKKEVEMLIKE